jgi:hypothetical protein
MAFRGAAPATPHKLSKTRKSSALAAHFDFKSKLDELLGPDDTSPSKGTVESEFDRYVSAPPSPRETDILRFWEVSASLTP